ncbi:hypothetical protein C0989_007643 [Termitomyces sp. Mn162]|nr:hypothetical protein C0989_007643 [Termitomyces sp. Mn162]
MATMLYDDDSSHLTYFPNQEQTFVSGTEFLGGSATSLTVGQDAPTLSVNFSGTYVTLFGLFFPSESVIVTIDGKGQSLAGLRFMKTNDIVYPFYQSPTLPDTTHILTIAINATSSTQNPGLVNTIVDYVTVTAGESTSLVGERLIVDESDPSVIFEGNWTQDTDPALSGSNGSLRYAYANTTHQTSSNGASATIPFNGLYSDGKSTCQHYRLLQYVL